MKTLKKIIPFILLASTATMSGCSMYSSKADTLENIVGFYELEIWKGKHEASDEDPYDRKAEEGTVAYFTIDKDGYAYYGFKDNKTEAWVKPAFATYKHDDDEPELYEAVTIEGKVDTVYAWEKHVGCLDESPMGFKRQEIKTGDGMFKKKEMVSTLSYTIPWHSYNIYNPPKVQKYQYVQYRRISDATGYAVINEKLGTNFSMTVPYEIYGLSGRWVYRCQPKEGGGLDSRGDFEYAILDLDSYSNGNLTVTYSLKASPGRQTTTAKVSVNEKGRSYIITFRDKAFNGTGIGCSTDQSTYGAESKVLDESFSTFYSANLSVDEIIELERIPQGPYLMHRVGDGTKQYEPLSYNEEYELIVNNVQLAENEEFAVSLNGGIWAYFEEYLEEGTANNKVVQGSVVPGTEEVDTKHMLKATEAGSYDFRIDTTNKIHIIHS